MKKLMSGLAIALVALTFTGCPKVLGDLEFTGTTGKCTIDYDNAEGKSTKRGMKIYATKHEGTKCTLIINEQTASSHDGQLGYVFNLDQNADKTYNFMIVGFRNNRGTSDTYISYFLNISEDSFSETNFGVDKSVTNNYQIYGTSSTKTKALSAFNVSEVKGNGVPSEVEIYSLPQNLGFALNTNKQLISMVEIVANDDGSYVVNFYKENKLTEKTSVTGTVSGYDLETNAIADKSFPISNTYTGYTQKTQAKLGVYAAVYAGKNLSGAWFASDLEGNPIPVEFEEFEFED